MRQMRKAVWYPQLMDRARSTGADKDHERDMIAHAHERYVKTMAKATYEIDAAGRRAIEDILRSAERTLTA